MNIIPFSPEYSEKAKSFVIGVLSDEGFVCDSLKDSDLDDIENNYIENGGAFFLAITGGEIAGSSAVRNLGSGICEIKRLYVKKGCRGRGLGLALFRKALEFAEKNYSLAKLKTDPSLKKAISLYMGHGFIRVKEEDGAVYFEKPL
jgi:putative acetyltransferase